MTSGTAYRNVAALALVVGLLSVISTAYAARIGDICEI